ncbi:MAG: VC0807 family protein [Verrucomicrobiales bacterium]|nr:VC0807 family protein [Verrucomicrobiota bacterium JB025]
MADPKNGAQEHPLVNILINVLIPVLALSYLSKEPAFQEALGKAVKPWHIGPTKALCVALVFPIGYGIWHFVKTRKANFFSALGLVSVLLTGGLTIFLWNKDGTVKENAAVLFGLKEASIPFILGLAVIGSHFTPNPLLRLFLYSDSLFDIQRIENRVAEIDGKASYDRILFQATLLFAASFLLSTFMNFGLAMYFLGGLDHTAANARELYNGQVAKLTGWGFAVIGLPILVFLFFTLHRLIKGLSKLTGLKDGDLMHPH